MSNAKAGRRGIRCLLAAGTIFVAALAIPAASPASAAERTFAPDGQFSILFAPKATLNKLGAGNVATQTWIGRDDDIYYAVSESSSNVAFDAPKELASNLANFLAQANATVLKQESRTWPTPHGPVPALRYTFRLPKGEPGKGVFVVSGATLYGAVAVDFATPAREPRLASVVDSLTLLK